MIILPSISTLRAGRDWKICSAMSTPTQSTTSQEPEAVSGSQQTEESVSLQDRLDEHDIIMETNDDFPNSDSVIHSAHHQPCIEEADDSDTDEKIEDESERALLIANNSNNRATMVLHGVNLRSSATGMQTTLGALTYWCLNFVFDLRMLSESIPPLASDDS